MSTYIIVEGRNLDLEKMMSYVGAVRKIMSESDSGSLLKQHGGRILLRTTRGDYEVLEGDDGADLYQVLAFPSLEQAKAFWLSDEYQDVKKLRDGAGDFRIILVDKPADKARG